MTKSNALPAPSTVRPGDKAESLQSRAGTMHADMTKLRQAPSNLLNNACKFTERERGSLEVTREPAAADAWLRFVMQDTGISMTRGQMARLFQAFLEPVDHLLGKIEALLEGKAKA